MVRITTAIVLAVLLAADRDDGPIRLTGGAFTHEVEPGETLTSIGARYGVSIKALIALNGLTSRNRLEARTMLRIDNHHLAMIQDDRVLSINVAQRMLYVVSDGAVVAVYPIAVGRRNWPTPTGAFSIIAKEIDPSWDVPASIQQEMRASGRPVVTRQPPGPDNPLGAYWIGLSIESLGLHGTIAPLSIYQFASHGCIRLHPDDVAELFGRIAVGDSGELIYEPVLLAQIGNRVWLEAHDDVYRRSKDAEQLIRRIAVYGEFFDRVDWNRAAAVLQRRHGVATDVTRE